MSNQEIEKRFLFDLEMGRFKRLPYDMIGFYSTNEDDCLKLEDFLKNIGYNLKTRFSLFPETEIPEVNRYYYILQVIPKTKIFKRLNLSKNTSVNITEYNKIPEYIEGV